MITKEAPVATPDERARPTLLDGLTATMLGVRSPIAFMALWSVWAPLYTASAVRDMLRESTLGRPIMWPLHARRQRGFAAAARRASRQSERLVPVPGLG